MRLIDADALKEKWLFRGEDGKPYRDEIDNAPTIDPVRHGRWIEYETEKWKCSECGNHEDLLDGKHHGWCGECGARMKARERDEYL